MIQIPDAPYIREAEADGIDAVERWLYGESSEDDEEN